MEIDDDNELLSTLEINLDNVNKIAEAIDKAISPLLDDANHDMALEDLFVVLTSMTAQSAYDLGFDKQIFLDWLSAAYDESEENIQEEDEELDLKKLN